jgi:hypothetical protein
MNRKIASITCLAHLYQNPQYILGLLTNHQPVRSLRLSNRNLLVVPSRANTVTASRAFCVTAPRLEYTSTLYSSTESFYVIQSKLKIHLFIIAFNYPPME